MSNRPYINQPHYNPNQTSVGTFELHEIDPEGFQALSQLQNELLAFRDLVLPKPERPQPDDYLDVEIFPLADPIDRDFSGGGVSKQRSPSTQVRSIQLLHDLKEGWGNDSKVMGFRFRTDHNKNDYQIALLKDEFGEVEAAVIETETEDNAAYVWQRRASDEPNWQRVFSRNRSHARANQAIRVNHGRKDIGERVLNLLTMDNDELLDILTK